MRSALLILSVLALARPATAQEVPTETSVCVLAFERGQSLRREGSLRAARDQLLLCAQSSCPELLSARCLPWLEEVRAAIPSIIVAAKDASGRDLVDVRVSIDGEVALEQLDGRPLEIDPGPRRIVIEANGKKRVERDVVIVEGEKGRRLDVVLASVRPPTPAATPSPAPTPTEPPDDGPSGAMIASYTLLSTGIAALVAGSVTGGLSIQRATDLRHLCHGTHCTPEYQAPHDEGLALAHASTACFAFSGAAFVGAIVAWAFDDDAQVVPSVAPSGLGLRGRF